MQSVLTTNEWQILSVLAWISLQHNGPFLLNTFLLEAVCAYVKGGVTSNCPTVRVSRLQKGWGGSWLSCTVMYYTVPTKLKRVAFYFLSAGFLSMFKADTLNIKFLNTFYTILEGLHWGWLLIGWDASKFCCQCFLFLLLILQIIFLFTFNFSFVSVVTVV